jgi:hypothetical protein
MLPLSARPYVLCPRSPLVLCLDFRSLRVSDARDHRRPQASLLRQTEDVPLFAPGDRSNVVALMPLSPGRRQRDEMPHVALSINPPLLRH